MESLVNVAKRLNIKPNPEMKMGEFRKICNQIGHELGTDSKTYNDRDLYKSFIRCKRATNMGQLRQNLNYLKTHKIDGIVIRGQESEDVSVDRDDIFVHHIAASKTKTVERVKLDINMDDPRLPELIDALDDFIVSYNAAYKMTDIDEAPQRTDTLNIYLSSPITEEMMIELYEIVKDYLNPAHDNQLNGYPVIYDGKQILGLRTGPEPKSYTISERVQIHEKAKKDLGTFFGNQIGQLKLGEHQSLGQLVSRIEFADLIYYLAGQEGKSPYALNNQLGQAGVPSYKPLNIQSVVTKTDDIVRDIGKFDFEHADEKTLEELYSSLKTYTEDKVSHATERFKKRKDSSDRVTFLMDKYSRLLSVFDHDDHYSVRLGGTLNKDVDLNWNKKTGAIEVIVSFAHGQRTWTYSPKGKVTRNVIYYDGEEVKKEVKDTPRVGAASSSKSKAVSGKKTKSAASRKSTVPKTKKPVTAKKTAKKPKIVKTAIPRNKKESTLIKQTEKVLAKGIIQSIVMRSNSMTTERLNPKKQIVELIEKQTDPDGTVTMITTKRDLKTGIQGVEKIVVANNGDVLCADLVETYMNEKEILLWKQRLTKKKNAVLKKTDLAPGLRAKLSEIAGEKISYENVKKKVKVPDLTKVAFAMNDKGIAETMEKWVADMPKGPQRKFCEKVRNIVRGYGEWEGDRHTGHLTKKATPSFEKLNNLIKTKQDVEFAKLIAEEVELETGIILPLITKEVITHKRKVAPKEPSVIPVVTPVTPIVTPVTPNPVPPVTPVTPPVTPKPVTPVTPVTPLVAPDPVPPVTPVTPPVERKKRGWKKWLVAFATVLTMLGLKGHGPVDKPARTQDAADPLPPPAPVVEKVTPPAPTFTPVVLTENVYRYETLDHTGAPVVVVDAIKPAPPLHDMEPQVPRVKNDASKRIQIGEDVWNVTLKTPLLLNTHFRKTNELNSHGGGKTSPASAYEVFTCDTLTGGNLARLPEIVEAFNKGYATVQRKNSTYYLVYHDANHRNISYKITRASKTPKSEAIPLVRLGDKPRQYDKTKLVAWLPNAPKTPSVKSR